MLNSDDNQATSEHPRKRAAVGDGISAGSASPLPFRDSESPPPQRSKARPTSAVVESKSDKDMWQGATFDDIQRPHVERKSLWTADQGPPLTRATFAPSNIASIQTQKSRNQLLQTKSKRPHQLPQSPQQTTTVPRQTGRQSPTNQPPSAIVSRSSNQSPQHPPKDEASFDIVLQPETRPISQEQLVAEVKGSKS